jgi:hypothetical protein
MPRVNSRRQPFTPEEDEFLLSLVESGCYASWSEIAKQIPGRSARQCRDRWTNYLAPAISFAPWRPEEDELIIQKVNEIGTKWSTIAKFAVGRTGNALKNRWYSGLKNLCSCDAAGKWALSSGPRQEDQAKSQMAMASWDQFLVEGEEGLSAWY